MASNIHSSDDKALQRNLMTSFIQIAALVVLAGYCIVIVGPFLSVVIWGIVLSVAIFPLHRKLSAALGDREKWSATLIAMIGIALLAIPGWIVVGSTIQSTERLITDVRDNTLEITAPPEKVAEWPLVGAQIAEVWDSAAENTAAFLEKYRTQARSLSERAVKAVSGLVFGLLGFMVSVIIAAICLLYADSGFRVSAAIGERIAPGYGDDLTTLSVQTIRSVTNGVLGVAAIQAVLAGIGFFLIGLPAPGILTLVILVTAIVQLPAILIMVPLIIWVFSFADPVSATIFAVYSTAVALSDNLLKPLLLGRGVDLPVLVVLIGAIGGMLKFGVIGLFLGAVILGLGYRIFSAWLDLSDPSATSEDASA